MAETPQIQKAKKIIPQPTLVFTSGPLAGRTIALGEDEGTIGRREDNTYILDDPRISRVHARVSKNAGSVFIEDLGSSAGTKVNGEALNGPHALQHGDRVAFGPIECSFEDPAAKPEDVTLVFDVPRIETGPHLSPRQQQVLELMAKGMTNNEIADELGVTERTVKAYAQELYDKLGVRNRAGAVAEAAKHGLI